MIFTQSAEEITQVIVKNMPDTGGDGAMWRSRAIFMMKGLINALVWQRDNKNKTLDANAIRDAMVFREMWNLTQNNELTEGMPSQVQDSIRAYMKSLPGYQESKGPNQAQTTLDQHGYLQMQFSQVFDTLSSPEIFESVLWEVDSEKSKRIADFGLLMSSELKKASLNGDTKEYREILSKALKLLK